MAEANYINKELDIISILGSGTIWYCLSYTYEGYRG
uniref:Uncharacterized protein n=1 Tax=viral metagenome TaxID=1070528 RepID=A0A6C0J496_9ZZZZ